MITKGRIIIPIIAALILTAPVSSYSQPPDARPVKYVRGRILSIDWAGSKIVIQRFYSTDRLPEDKMVFSIPGDARVFTDKRKIFRDVRAAGVADLIVGDRVIIGYCDGPNKGGREVVTIRILEHDRPAPP